MGPAYSKVPQNAGQGLGRSIIYMTRGNQRELAREKNLKKQKDKSKNNAIPEGMTLAQKKTMDAEIMRKKQLEAEVGRTFQQQKK